MTWVEVTTEAPVDGELVTIEVGAASLVLARASGTVYAVDGWCTHDECPLGDGWLEGDALRCACHGALFDLSTGAVVEGPAEKRLATYPVRVSERGVEVEVP